MIYGIDLKSALIAIFKLSACFINLNGRKILATLSTLTKDIFASIDRLTIDMITIVKSSIFHEFDIDMKI